MATTLEDMGCLDRLRDFVAGFGADFFGCAALRACEALCWNSNRLRAGVAATFCGLRLELGLCCP